jgi:hypothetical protein
MWKPDDTEERDHDGSFLMSFGRSMEQLLAMLQARCSRIPKYEQSGFFVIEKAAKTISVLPKAIRYLRSATIAEPYPDCLRGAPKRKLVDESRALWRRW